MISIIIPIITALIGLVGGLSVGILKMNTDRNTVKQNHDDAMRRLALEIVKLEFERAGSEGRSSSHGIHSHIAVIQALLNEYSIDLNAPDFIQVIDDLTRTYKTACWEPPYDPDFEVLDEVKQRLIKSTIAPSEKSM